MKQLTISRDSWHYKLALYGLLSEDRDETDLCRYWWAMVRGALRAPFLAVLGALAAFVLVVDPLIAVAVFVSTGLWVLPVMAPLTFAVYLVGLVVLLEAYRRDRRQRHPDREPGFIGTAYRGWKDKTCVLVRVK